MKDIVEPILTKGLTKKEAKTYLKQVKLIPLYLIIAQIIFFAGCFAGTYSHQQTIDHENQIRQEAIESLK